MTEDPVRPWPAPTRPRPTNEVRLAVGQLVVLGTAAGLILPRATSGEWLVLVFFVGPIVLLLVTVAALLALTYLLGTLTRYGSRLTEGPAGRFYWTLLIWAGGAALVSYGRAALRDLGFAPGRQPEVEHLLLAAGTAAVVGLCTRSRPIQVGSAVLIGLFVAITAIPRALG